MKRTLGLDHGEKRIGVAVSDELGLLAHPGETYHRRSRAEDVDYVKGLVHTYDVGTIAVGFPKHMNGDLGTSAKRVTRALLKSAFMGRWTMHLGIHGAPSRHQL